MAFDRPADLFSESALLSRLDPEDDENVKDAAYQLERCATDFDLASWARRWGRPLTHALLIAKPIDEDALEEATEAANRAENDFNELHDAVSAALRAFDAMAVDLPDEVVNRINDIFAKLEAAL